MSFTETLKNNPALLDELIVDMARLIAKAIAISPRIAVEGETEPMRALILAWVARVEAAAAAQAKPNEGGPT